MKPLPQTDLLEMRKALKADFETAHGRSFDTFYLERLNTSRPFVCEDGESNFNFTAHPYLMVYVMLTALKESEQLRQQARSEFEMRAVLPRINDAGAAQEETKTFNPNFAAIYREIDIALEELNQDNTPGLAA